MKREKPKPSMFIADTQLFPVAELHTVGDDDDLALRQNLVQSAVDPPVARGVKIRSHHRQQAFEAEFWAGWSAGVIDPRHPDAP